MSTAEDIAAAATVASGLIKSALDLLEAAKAGDAEAERQAILRGHRVTSDELARREALSTEPPPP